MKVSINYSDGNVVSLPLVDAAPSLFAGEAGIVAALNAQNQTVTMSKSGTSGPNTSVVRKWAWPGKQSTDERRAGPIIPSGIYKIDPGCYHWRPECASSV